METKKLSKEQEAKLKLKLPTKEEIEKMKANKELLVKEGVIINK